MKRPDIDSIQARLTWVTPGPWRYEDDAVLCPTGASPFPSCIVVDEIVNTDDAQFIAHARSDIPTLLEYIAQLERQRKALQDLREAMYYAQPGYVMGYDTQIALMHAENHAKEVGALEP